MLERKKKKHYFRNFLLLLLVLFFILLLVLLYYINKIQTHKLNTDNITINDISDDNISGYWNIALFGVDSRENDLSKNTRSDCIIVASINKKTKKVNLASIYRDTYVPIDGHNHSKINAAYNYGGPELAISTINKCFDLDIKDFVTVNFNAVSNVVNALGGVEIDIKSDEIKEVNRYINDVNKINKTNSKHLTKTGKQILDGTQATAYSRVRYTTGNDFRRAERQRTVIYAILNKAKSSGVTTLLKVTNEMLPQIYTSLDSMDIISLAKDVFSYEINNDNGFPIDKKTGTVNRASIVMPVTLSINVTKLHEFLFGTKDYVPTKTVQSISSELSRIPVR